MVTVSKEVISKSCRKQISGYISDSNNTLAVNSLSLHQITSLCFVYHCFHHCLMLAFKYKNCRFKYQVAGFYKILNTLSEHKSLSWLLRKQQKNKSVKQRSAFAALQPKWISCHKANLKSHNECCN